MQNSGKISSNRIGAFSCGGILERNSPRQSISVSSSAAHPAEVSPSCGLHENAGRFVPLARIGITNIAKCVGRGFEEANSIVTPQMANTKTATMQHTINSLLILAHRRKKPPRVVRTPPPNTRLDSQFDANVFSIRGLCNPHRSNWHVKLCFGSTCKPALR
jgi:hypothetical protein